MGDITACRQGSYRPLAQYNSGVQVAGGHVSSIGTL